MITKEITSLTPPNPPERISNSSSSHAIRYLPSALDLFLRNVTNGEPVILPSKDTSVLNTGIFIKTESCYKKINAQDIYLVEALSDYINIYTKEKRYTIHSTMYGILEKLPASDFMRVHKSYIVRLDSISAIEDNMLSVEDKLIPVTKTYKDELMSRLILIG